jgi:hypothetical protein
MTTIPLTALDTFSNMSPTTPYARALSAHPSLEVQRGIIEDATTAPEPESVPFDADFVADAPDRRTQSQRRQDFAEDVLQIRAELCEYALRDVLGDATLEFMATHIWPLVNAAELAGEVRA